MKILNIEESHAHYVKTDDGEYIRQGRGNWKQLFGESWEGVSDCSELDEAWEEYRKAFVMKSRKLGCSRLVFAAMNGHLEDLEAHLNKDKSC